MAGLKLYIRVLGTLVATSKVRIGLENFTLDGNRLRTLYGSEKAFFPIMSRVGMMGPLEGIGFSVKTGGYTAATYAGAIQKYINRRPQNGPTFAYFE